DEQVREEFELKIFGVWNVVRAARPHLATSPVGAVVNTNAILAKQPEGRLAITSAARAALLHLSRTPGDGRAPDGIRVTSVSLGRRPEGRPAIASAGRAALLNLSRTLGEELAPDGIRVNSVNLGLIDTGQWRRRFETYRSEGGDLDYDAWSAELAADRGISLG